jgi:hypothetical protein
VARAYTISYYCEIEKKTESLKKTPKKAKLKMLQARLDLVGSWMIVVVASYTPRPL